MEVNVKISADERLLSAIVRLADALTGRNTMTIGVPAEPVSKPKKKVADTSQISDTQSATPISDAIKENPCVDPTTGEYFKAFTTMADALDCLVSNGQHDDVQALLKVNSTDGTYGGIPPKLWSAVENNARQLLKKTETTEQPAVTITLEQIKEKATTFVKENKAVNRPKMEKLLQKYDVKNISGLREKDFDAFYEDLQKVGAE